MASAQLSPSEEQSLPEKNDATEPSQEPAREPAAIIPTFSPEEKAAVILQVLGPDSAEAIVAQFDERDFRACAQGMSKIQGIAQERIDEVIKEFVLLLHGGGGAVGGAPGDMKSFLLNFLNKDVVEQIMEDVRGPVGRTIWEKLSNCPDEALAAYLKLEQTQTVALILSKLRPEKAATVLSFFPIDRAKRTVLRMSRATRVDPMVLDTVKKAVARDFLSSVNKRHSARPPADVLGSIMNNLPMSMNDELLSALRDKDVSLAERVQNAMFTFPDIASRVDSAGVQILVKSLDSATLCIALKLAKEKSPVVADFFLSNISKRALENLEDEMEALGPIRAKDAEAAQQLIVRKVQDLASAGSITLMEGDDQFI